MQFEILSNKSMLMLVHALLFVSVLVLNIVVINVGLKTFAFCMDSASLRSRTSRLRGTTAGTANVALGIRNLLLDTLVGSLIKKHSGASVILKRRSHGKKMTSRDASVKLKQSRRLIWLSTNASMR